MVDVLEVPAYSLPEAARYVRVPHTTLRYWTQGRGEVGPLVESASIEPLRLSEFKATYVFSFRWNCKYWSTEACGVFKSL